MNEAELRTLWEEIGICMRKECECKSRGLGKTGMNSQHTSYETVAGKG